MPVTVKINGLPAGLKADPVTIAGKDSNFIVKYVVAEARKRQRLHGRHASRPGVPGGEEGLFTMALPPLAVKVVAGK